MKKVVAILTSCLVIIGIFSGCSPSSSSKASSAPSSSAASSEALSGTITWWTYFDQAPYLQKAFEAKYPNIKVNLQTFGGDDYETKLMTTLMSGQKVPDVFDLEEGYVYKFVNSNDLADLDKYGAKSIVSDYYGWAAAMGTDQSGEIKGICDNVSPIAFWYLRDAMKKWLGTDDPDQISKDLGSWADIKQEAQKVKTASNGKVWLWPNIDEMALVQGYSLTPFIRNGQFSVPDGWTQLMDTMRDFYKSGLVANLDSWSSNWASAWNSGTLLIRTMPSWDYFTDWKKNTGNVGVAKPFLNSYEGGTYRAVYAKSKNIPLCMQFIKFDASEEFQQADLKDNAQVPANTQVFANIGKSYSDPKFGGQNILSTYNDISNGIPKIVPDLYTRDVQNMFASQCETGIKKGQTDDQILKAFEAAVKDKYPEVQGL